MAGIIHGNAIAGIPPENDEANANAAFPPDIEANDDAASTEALDGSDNESGDGPIVPLHRQLRGLGDNIKGLTSSVMELNGDVKELHKDIGDLRSDIHDVNRDINDIKKLIIGCLIGLSVSIGIYMKKQ